MCLNKVISLSLSLSLSQNRMNLSSSTYLLILYEKSIVNKNESVKI